MSLVQDKVTSGVLSSSLILLGTRAYQIYNSALMRKTDIEKQMAKVRDCFFWFGGGWVCLNEFIAYVLVVWSEKQSCRVQ